MHCSTTCLWTQKQGEDEYDYKDAFAPRKNEILNGEYIGIAIADGATDAAFSAEWAKMLVRNFIRSPFLALEDFQVRVEKLSERWQSKIVNRRQLSWFAEQKAQEGAFSTLLGLIIISNSPDNEKSGEWNSIAVGDSCLFHIRNDDLKLTFPVQKSNDFGNSPSLVSSNLSRNKDAWDNYRVINGEWHNNDVFILATDSLSKWFLRECEMGNKPWKELIAFSADVSKNDFSEWVSNKRSSSSMKNDDATCIIIKV
jgi:hypothetical protein